MTPWEYIVIHHSGVDDDHVRLDFDNFRTYHVGTRGWADVGYHFGIEKVDNGYEVIVGRPLTMVGSHAKGFNRKAIGVVFAGNFNKDKPPIDMLRVAVYRIIRPLMKTFDIPASRIIGHNDTGRKTDCPGNQFDVGLIRRLV